MYVNPLEVDRADVKDSFSLDADEVLVVYSKDRVGTGRVTRRVQYGPTVFTPTADEW